MDYIDMKHITIRLTELEAEALRQVIEGSEFFEDFIEEYLTKADKSLLAAAYRARKKLANAQQPNRIHVGMGGGH